jgi:hypothetical protein
MGQIVQGYGVPRWLHTQIDVPLGSEIRIDSDAFANNTWHRERLVALTFASGEPVEFASGNPPIPDVHPGWASDLLIDIGKSQCSDINLVSGSLTSLCANPRRQRQMAGAINMGRSYRFPTPYQLPRDEGLYVRAEYIRTPFAIVKDVETEVGPEYSDEVTFIAKGFYEDGYPGMLAGRADRFEFKKKGGAHLQQGNSVEMISADLFNGGKRPLYLTELCFKEMDVQSYYTGGEVRVYTPSMYGTGMTFAWLVNPTNPTATKWMPSSQCIPTALLTPQCRNYDTGSSGPLAYFFPPGTYLDPKQALSIRLGNTSSEKRSVRVCLIGELEVR